MKKVSDQMVKMETRAKRMVIFGAGNIGRSFIGLLFSRAGYAVTFVDIDRTVVDALNARGSYTVVIKQNDREDRTVTVSNVRGVYGNDIEAVGDLLARADIAATCVGKKALAHLGAPILKGLMKRQKLFGDLSLDIILAENVHHCGAFFRNILQRECVAEYPLDKRVGLVEASIGKMVPLMPNEIRAVDPLMVYAEPFNTLIVDKNGFTGEIPHIPDIQAKSRFNAWVDRKLYIHNLGHAAAAYLGFQANREWKYLYEALADPVVYAKTRQAMTESAQALLKEYPGVFSQKELSDHIEDLLERFQNRALADTIFRVGRDLYRKLSKSDRIIGAMLLATKHRLRCDTIAEVFIAALTFSAADEKGKLFAADENFFAKLMEEVLRSVLSGVCALSGFNEHESEIMKTIAHTLEQKVQAIV